MDIHCHSEGVIHLTAEVLKFRFRLSKSHGGLIFRATTYVARMNSSCASLRLGVMVRAQKAGQTELMFPYI